MSVEFAYVGSKSNAGRPAAVRSALTAIFSSLKWIRLIGVPASATSSVKRIAPSTFEDSAVALLRTMSNRYSYWRPRVVGDGSVTPPIVQFATGVNADGPATRRMSVIDVVSPGTTA